jgi:hypothetical protein
VRTLRRSGDYDTTRIYIVVFRISLPVVTFTCTRLPARRIIREVFIRLLLRIPSPIRWCPWDPRIFHLPLLLPHLSHLRDIVVIALPLLAYGFVVRQWYNGGGTLGCTRYQSRLDDHQGHVTVGLVFDAGLILPPNLVGSLGLNPFALALPWLSLSGVGPYLSANIHTPNPMPLLW